MGTPQQSTPGWGGAQGGSRGHLEGEFSPHQCLDGNTGLAPACSRGDTALVSPRSPQSPETAQTSPAAPLQVPSTGKSTFHGHNEPEGAPRAPAGTGSAPPCPSRPFPAPGTSRRCRCQGHEGGESGGPLPAESKHRNSTPGAAEPARASLELFPASFQEHLHLPLLPTLSRVIRGAG